MIKSDVNTHLSNQATGYTTNLSNNHTKVFTPRPHSFVDLMEMYERNYIHLRLFCGDIHQLPDESISRVAGSVPVKLTVLERSSHTTMLMLTYLFENADNNSTNSVINTNQASILNTHKKQRRPDLKIQVYHDSRQVSVVSRSCQISGKELRLWEKQIDSVLLCRWRLNRFLYKWLHYLSYKGHDFKET